MSGQQGLYKHIVVPISSDPHSLDAVVLACALARPRRATVTAVHVIEVGRQLPLDAHLDSESKRGEQLLRKAEDVAKRADYHINGELLKARDAGTAIVEQAEDSGADLIVLGVTYHHHTSGSHIGHASDYVVRHAKCEVLLLRGSVHEHAGEEEEHA